MDGRQHIANVNVSSRLLKTFSYVSFILHLAARSTVVVNSRVVGKKRGSADNQRLVISNHTQLLTSVWLVCELGAEDISEFHVMFHMSTDSFNSPSRRFAQQIARLDG